MISAGFRTWMLALLVCCGLMPEISFAHKIVVDDAHEVAPRRRAVVLDPADPVPPNAVMVSKAEFKGNADGSYRDLLHSAYAMATNSGANVIKITERRNRNSGNNAEQLKVTFYRSDNPHTHEKEFAWNADRKLNWNDFRGPVMESLGEDVAAATFCGIGFETNTISATNPKLKVYVYNTFYTGKSFVREGLRTPEILAHEQCHFDICELYTRKLRERMSTVSVSVETLQTRLRKAYNEVQKEYAARQERYEEETQHGLIPQAQQRWQDMIAAELKTMDRWRDD